MVPGAKTADLDTPDNKFGKLAAFSHHFHQHMLHSFSSGDALLLHDHSAPDLRHPVQRRLRLPRRRRGQRITAGGGGE